MARKIKFALEMSDGTFVSVLEDLKSHIKNNDDVKKLVEYYLDGRLEKWLLDRYYEEEAKAVQSLNKYDPDFACKLCKAIGVDYTPLESVNVGLIEHEKKMKKALEEVTDDINIIENAGSTASTQSELDFLIKNGKKTIYLLGDWNSFNLPVVDNISYIGVLGKPSIDIELADLYGIKNNDIKLKNVNLLERFNPFKNANIRDYVKMGSYPQSANGDFQPIEWQLLAREKNDIIVISRYALDVKRFDTSSNNWKNSEIRKWLNGEFYNKAFDENEKKYIRCFDGDNVFLLSKEETEKYFANDNVRRCKATDYAKNNGAWVNSRNGYSVWELRSPDPNYSYKVYSVYYNGNIGCAKVQDNNNVVRPAMWIKL